MPHNEIKVEVAIFDTVFDRAEYWRKALGNISRSKFYDEAVFMHCNHLSGWYPKLKEGEIEYLNNLGKQRRVAKEG